MSEQLLVERAPVDADAHRLAVLDRRFDDGRELAVLLVLEADIAGIDAVLVERLGAGGMIGQELVADIVEVAHQRHLAALLQQPLLDVRHGGGGLVAVDRDAYDLGAGARQRSDLPDRRVDIGSVGVSHRLHDDRRAAANRHIADVNRHRHAPFLRNRFAHSSLLRAVPVPEGARGVNVGPASGALISVAMRANPAHLDHLRFRREADRLRG
jgi:hypothetical protein